MEAVDSLIGLLIGVITGGILVQVYHVHFKNKKKKER